MIKRNTHDARRTMKKGFTLLEVLISLIILVVGVIAIIWAFSSGIFASTDVENVDLALNIAQANMETIKDKAFADIDTDIEISSLVSNQGFSDFTVTGDVAEGNNPMQVDVTVAWNVKGGQTNVTLTTLVVDY